MRGHRHSGTYDGSRHLVLIAERRHLAATWRASKRTSHRIITSRLVALRPQTGLARCDPVGVRLFRAVS
jgi:hypothetical protein